MGDEIWRPRRFVPWVATLSVVMFLLFQCIRFWRPANHESMVEMRFGERVVKDSSEDSSTNPWNLSSEFVSGERRGAMLPFSCLTLSLGKISLNGDAVFRGRRLLRGSTNDPIDRSRISPRHPHAPFSHSPSPAPKSSQSRKEKIPNSVPGSSPTQEPPTSSPSPSPSLIPAPATISTVSPPLSAPVASSSRLKNHLVLTLIGSIGGPAVVFLVVIAIFVCRSNKVATVRPWATGLSGQLQRAFVTGVPKLKKSELESACEDFSNVVGTSSIGTVFKGTLSTGVEIAVISVAVASSKDWTRSSESQFRKKIDTLSKVNHKNFVNLLGHCEEDRPFTRMMVFEYAPNGTLFEHLHMKEAEHLDWGMRLRVAMGIAYCLEHMHQLTPPIAHNHLNSSVINLAEDYAAKVSDFSFSNELPTQFEMGPTGLGHPKTHSAGPEGNVHSFGLILLEMVSGRLPYSANDGLVEEWATEYLRGCQPLLHLLDPTLQSFREEQLGRIDEVIKSCVLPQPQEKPSMREVTASLREITGIRPDQAIPKLSPLWWAELEIVSMDKLEDEVQSSAQFSD